MALDLARLAELRHTLTEHDAALDRTRAAIQEARASVRAARRVNDAEAAKEGREALRNAAERRRRRLQRRAATLEEIEALRRAGEAELAAPEARVDGLGADLPMVLLPLRIETRFLPVDGPPAELVVRIYPDEIHVDDHDPALTPAEEADGRDYWRQVWRAGPGSEGGPAWERLRDIHGGPRAAWIVRSTVPVNPTGRPAAPVDEGEPLRPDPQFPVPARRPAGSARPTRAAWLPDRFAAVGYVAGAPAVTAWGELVAEELLVGPLEDPLADDRESLGTSPDVDELDVPELGWLTDLEEAVAAGMAIRIPLDDRIRSGLERLVVVGVRADATPKALAADLARLVEAHAHTGGAEIAAPGRPTNDAAGPPPAQPPLLEPRKLSAESAGARLAAAFGIGPRRLADLPGAHAGDPARAMNALLWPSTLGYYLEQLALPVVSDDAIDAARRWFIDHVRGRGHLPTLIAGAQPYGILPVTVAARLQPGDAFARQLADLLGRLRGWWREAASRAPRLGRTGDPEADLNEVLGQAPVMQRLRIREGLGRHYLENLYRHPTAAAPIGEAALDQQRLVANALLSTLSDRRLEARISEIALRMRSSLFHAPLVAATPSGDRLEDDYLGATREALTGASPGTGLRALPEDGPLLRRLARHGALLSLGEGSGRVLRDLKGLPSRVLMEAELVDVERRQDTHTSARRLAEQVSVSGATSTAVDVLMDGARQAGLGRMDAVLDITVLDDLVRGDAHRRHAALLEYEWALARLAEESSAGLDLLLREGFDTVSHRLDAWLTSLAWQRLLDLRAAKPGGVHVGAYGIVEDLRPAPRLQPSGDEPGLFVDAGAGYVHAPSLDQAAAAAVLRAGYVAHGRGDAFAVDLSAARVRTALGVVDALRAGHPLGAVLGYRFERRLHELGLDRYVPVFRELAPLHGESEAGESQVADGLALRGRFADRARLADHMLPGAARSDPRFEREPALDRAGFVRVVGGIVDELDDLVDGVSDLMLADAAHASVQGNQARARAIADAARSGSLPPEPEVARTPRTGVTFANRIAVAMNAATGPARGWRAGIGRPRQIAEPRLDRWAGTVLGDPSALVQRLRVVAPSGEETTATVAVADLRVAALDVVYGVRAAGTTGRCELDERFVAAAEKMAGADGATIEPVGEPRWRVLATELHSLISSARPLAPADLGLAGDDPGTLDEAEWRQRADAVRDLLGAADRDDPSKPPGERIAALLGQDFRSVPLVTARRRRELAATLARSAELQGGDPLAAAGWLAGVGRVRPEADRLARVMALGDALSDSGPSLVVGQLPHDPNPERRWIGLEIGREPPPAQVALAISSPDHLDPTGPLAGLLVDDWADVVPRAEETTAVAMHYDRPSTEAPNCALLAVHPGDRATWDLATVTDTVVEAVELARLRAVDLQVLQMVGRLLPATYMPRNVTGDAFSFDFTHVDFDASVATDR